MDLRERTRRAVRAGIGEAAIALFLTHGFDAVTMDQIAAAAGVSRRSLFRYFATKEDIVLGNLIDSGRACQAVLEARPADEAPWDALRAAFASMARQPGHSLADMYPMAKMLVDTPALRGAHLEKQQHWLELLTPDVERRLGAEPGDPGARALVAAAMACLNTAIETWVRRNGDANPEAIFDAAVAAVRA